MKWVGRGIAAVLAAGFLYVFVWALVTNRDPRAVPSPLVCKTAPAIDGPGLSDERVTLSPGEDSYTLVNFWASWCAACKQEHPELMALAASPPVENFRFVGVLFQDEVRDALRTEKREGKVGPTALDEDGRLSLDYGVTGAPETFIVNPHGKIVKKFVGPVTYDAVAHVIEHDREEGLCREGQGGT